MISKYFFKKATSCGFWWIVKQMVVKKVYLRHFLSLSLLWLFFLFFDYAFYLQGWSQAFFPCSFQSKVAKANPILTLSHTKNNIFGIILLSRNWYMLILRVIGICLRNFYLCYLYYQSKTCLCQIGVTIYRKLFARD